MGELKEYRKLSDNELTYIKFNNITNNYFQIVIECDKDSIIVNDIENAVKNICNYSEYLNLIIKNNKFYFTKRELKLNIIEGITELFNRKLSNDFIDIYYFKSITNDYLLFKFNHSYVDGQGALYIIRLLISILNKTEIDGNIDYISDLEYATQIGTTKFKEHLNYNNKIKKLSDDSENQLIIKRVKIDKNSNAILPKIIKVLTSYYTNDNQTFLIPTSIRKREENKIYISNLSLPLYLKINKNDEWNDIYLKIYKGINEKKNLNIYNIKYGMLLKVNNNIFKIMIKMSNFIQRKTRKYFTCGSITNMGIINLKNYSSDKIKINRMFNIPFFQPLLPLSITIMESANGIDIVFVANSSVINEKNVENILNEIKEIIEKN